MRYEIVFVPSEEKMKEYKPWNEDKAKRESFLNDYKRELVSYCMKKHDKTAVIQLSRELNWKLRTIYAAVEQEEKESLYFRWKENEKHEVWYCGLEFSRDSYFDFDDYLEQKVDDLLVLVDMVETPDYFENSDNFYKKLKDVKEKVDGAVEIFEDIIIHKIIDDLREFEKKEDDEEENNKEAKQMTSDGMIEALEAWNLCTLTDRGRARVRELFGKGLSFDAINSMLEPDDKIPDDIQDNKEKENEEK